MFAARARSARASSWVALSCAWLALGGVAAAKEPAVSRLQIGGHIEEAYNDNIEQAPAGETKDDFITNAGAQLQLSNDRLPTLPSDALLGVDGYVYADNPDYDYVEIRPELRYQIDRFEPYVQYMFSPRRLLFADDSGPTLENAFYADHFGGVGFRGKFGERKQLRTRLSFDIEYQNFRQGFTGHNSISPGMRAGSRYTFLPLFTAIFDFQYAARTAHRNNYDRNEIEFSPGFESQLTDWLMLRLRYKHEWRSYTVAAPTTASGRANGNFDRNDDIQQVETWLTMPLPFWRGLVLGLRYRYRNGDSNRSDRKYDVHEGGVELSYAFSSEWFWER